MLIHCLVTLPSTMVENSVRQGQSTTSDNEPMIKKKRCDTKTLSAGFKLEPVDA